MEEQIPDTIWIIAEEEISEPLTSTGARDARRDIGGTIAGTNNPKPTVIGRRTPVTTEKLKQEMDKFLKVVGYVFDRAKQPLSDMQLEELQLSVEINGEGQVSLLGIGGKAGSKGAISLKFKRVSSPSEEK